MDTAELNRKPDYPEQWKGQGTECLLWLSLHHITGLQESHGPEAGVKSWRMEDVPLVKDDPVREYLSKLGIHKSMGPDGFAHMLRELAFVVARPFSIIFALLWQLGEVHKDQGKANVTPIFKNGKKENPRDSRLVSLIWPPGKGDSIVNSGHFQVHEVQENLQ